MVFDGAMKLMELDVAVKTTAELGYPKNAVFGLGNLTLVCTVLYALPPTSILGTILVTGLLGGAIATHLRLGSPISLIFCSRVSRPDGLGRASLAR
jgi:DoxX-like family